MQFLLTENQYVLVTLLIQMGVIAAISTILVRFDTFKRMLFNEKLGWPRKFYLIGIIGAIFGVGVLARLLLNYKAADLTLPSTLLVGILAGPAAGACVGIIIGLPTLLFHEYLALPLAVLYGLYGGLIFLKEPSLEKRMDFSPFSILKIPRYLNQLVREKKFAVQLLILISCVFLQLLNLYIAKYSEGKLLYSLYSSNYLIIACIILGTLASVGIPLKIWNNTRVELLLSEKEKKLTEAKLEALKSKMKPHFLFNTLNTIFSTIRIDPDKARSVVLRLSEVLRFILDSKDEYCKLSDEINLIDSYLSIEEARFGKGRVKFEKEIGEGIQNLYVPAMILQPIVENSIIHGISKNLDSGTISLRAKKDGEFLEISVKDDGAGIPSWKMEKIKSSGIGLSSIEERLKALFEENFSFTIESKEAIGTTIKLRIPAIDDPKDGAA